MDYIQDFTIRDEENRKHIVEIIHQDEAVLAVNKPPGLRVIPDRWSPDLPCLTSYLTQKLKKAGVNRLWVVHRIDADTSGIVLFALKPETHRSLNEAFDRHEIRKTYLAVVRGKPDKAEGVIDMPIAPARNPMVKIHPDGKPSRTEYKVKEIYRRHALLEVYPQTGRTHQIRIHFQAGGFPLAVDPLYANKSEIRIWDLKRKYGSDKDSDSAIISRLTLHAWKVRFSHPFTGKTVDLMAKPYKDFRGFIQALRKWDR